MSEEVTKKKSGVGDYIFPWISIVCATAIFYGSQFLSAIIMVIFHVNIEKSEGLFALVYSVIAIAALGVFAFFSKNVVLTNAFFIQSNPNRRINPLNCIIDLKVSKTNS